MSCSLARAVFKKTEPGRIHENCSSPKKPTVSGVTAAWSETTSAPRTAASRSWPAPAT